MTDYTVIRSHRRTMALEVTREGAALVRAPYAASDAAIARFAAQHQAWLESHMARRQAYLAAHPVHRPSRWRHGGSRRRRCCRSGWPIGPGAWTYSPQASPSPPPVRGSAAAPARTGSASHCT